MKKTLTVNLGGTVFHIDEDAYRLLDNYLCNLKVHFRKQEGAEEIVDDIENRISELFGEKINAGSQVINIADVEEVISRVGKPEDFDDEPASGSSSEQKGNSFDTNAQGTHTTYRHRLFRNPDNRILGGVASGIAAYLDWDVTLVRVLFICLLFVPYCPMLFLYIIAWIVIPEARTATDKLHMRGEAVTVENIGKTVTDGFEKVASGVNDYMKSDKPRTFLQKLGDTLVQVAGVVLKACLIVLAVIFSPVLFVMALLFLLLLVAFVMLLAGGGTVLYHMFPLVDWAPLESVSPLMVVGGSMAGIALLAIPILSILYTALQQTFHWSPMNSGVKWTLFIVWVIALVVFLLNMFSLGWQFPLYGIHPV